MSSFVSQLWLLAKQGSASASANTARSVWRNESWQPSTGAGLGKGTGICDFGGSGLPSPPLTEVAKKWHLLKPGESFSLQATQASWHFASSNPGVCTFSAVYLPPSLGESQIRASGDAGIPIPQRKATSARLRYEKRQRQVASSTPAFITERKIVKTCSRLRRHFSSV